MSRDFERAAVYAAEELVFAETLFAEPLGVADILDLAALIAQEPWWQRCGIPFSVRPTRREAHHSYASPPPGDDAVAQIRLSLHQQDAATLAHEVAHLLGGRHGSGPPHGPIFRSAAVDVASVVCGRDTADRLQRSFVDAGLKTAPRRWPCPPDSARHGLYGQWRLAGLANLSFSG